MAGHLKGSFAGVRLAGDFDGTFVPSTRIVQEDEVTALRLPGRGFTLGNVRSGSGHFAVRADVDGVVISV